MYNPTFEALYNELTAAENHYIHHLGTSFGILFLNVIDVIDGVEVTRPLVEPKYHSFRAFGLYPKGKPIISTPEVQTVMIEVPGRNGLLDATEALTGDVRYYNRKGEFEFTQAGGRKQWDVTYHHLKNKLHGKRMEVWIDEEKDGYYVGRLSVGTPSYDDKKGIATFKVTADLEPFKYALTTSDQDWLWDPFSFQTGYIQDPTVLYQLLPGAAHMAFIEFNSTSEGVEIVDLADNYTPVCPSIEIVPVGNNSDNAKVKMYYPTQYPIVETGEGEDFPPAVGWGSVTLGVGRHEQPAPDFVIGKQYGYAAFELLETPTADEVQVKLYYRRGWL